MQRTEIYLNQGINGLVIPKEALELIRRPKYFELFVGRPVEGAGERHFLISPVKTKPSDTSGIFFVPPKLFKDPVSLYLGIAREIQMQPDVFIPQIYEMMGWDEKLCYKVEATVVRMEEKCLFCNLESGEVCDREFDDKRILYGVI